MQRCVLTGAVVACLAAVLSFVALKRQPVAPDNQQFTFYKISLQWPPATCEGITTGCTCDPTDLGNFTIKGLWPHFSNGTAVPPYAPTAPCTNVTPEPPPNIMQYIRPATKSKLVINWPDLKDYRDVNTNHQFWRYEWAQHGMCSDWPDQPENYFKAGLDLHAQYTSLLSSLAGAGFIPNAQNTYKVGAISDALKNIYGGNRNAPEISCNEDKNGVRQLHEIRVCFQRNQQRARPTVLKNCPTLFSNKCSRNTDMVKFPPP